MTAEAQLRAPRRVDGCFVAVASVDLELQPLFADNRDGAVAVVAYGRVMRVDGQIGQVDRVVADPANADRLLFRRVVANDLSPVGGDRYLADDECHAPAITNRRTR